MRRTRGIVVPWAPAQAKNAKEKMAFEYLNVDDLLAILREKNKHHQFIDRKVHAYLEKEC
jgi:hypothetical protein